LAEEAQIFSFSSPSLKACLLDLPSGAVRKWIESNKAISSCGVEHKEGDFQ
jgi:hypothetical protein